MASDHQVALTRPHRMPSPSTHISKAARQVVPAFLQKLYEMVNDPNNAELIRWSEAGDSFFVLDHERFAHEVLGRWFKHRNFSSFVRQLNMYGFHKIPHLQQGVLKSDTDTEFWNFAHASFHRGQPDLLCLIQRKKQVPQPGEEGTIDLRDPTASVGLLGNAVPGTTVPNTNAPPANPALSSGQILDVHSIVNGIAAIKRHQTTISAELNELKRSNQLLWQDALAARAKHQKQQDTINRIVKFLAGVFGHAAAAGPVAAGSPGVPGGQHGKEDGVAESLSVAPGTRRKMRLMIEDAKRDGPRKSMVEELTEMPMDMEEPIYEPSYPTIETPASASSPSPSVSMSDGLTVADASAYYNNIANPTPTVDSKLDSRSPSSASTMTDSTLPTYQPEPQRLSQQQSTQQQQISRAVTPSRHSPALFEFDPRLQGVLNQLSPSQIQQLLSSLASQPLADTNPPGPSIPSSTINPNATTTSGGLLTPYHQPSSFDFSINPSSQTVQGNTFNPAMPLISPDGLIPFDHYDPGSPNDDRNANLNLINNNATAQQQQHEAKMERQWQQAEDIDKDVNALNSSINSLIQTYGLDPSLLEDHHLGSGVGDGAVPHDHDRDHDMEGHEQTDLNVNAADFDFFDSFFNNMPSSSGAASGGIPTDQHMHAGDNVGGVGGGAEMDYGDLASTAFLDEVPTSSSSDLTASPAHSLSTGLNPGSGGGAKTTTTSSAGGGRKRKSDVILDFEGVNGPGSDAIQTSTATKTTTGTTKSKRRKDK
ncbi:hypothetical protein BDZ97DRAFT_1804489 [Flammula alnicola]|nr:hypothetical protein BDZ97DRAFT_1804489 [Flammula alnicola]